jgi:hypothetical protein
MVDSQGYHENDGLDGFCIHHAVPEQIVES